MRIKLLYCILSFPLFLTHCAHYDFSRRVVQQGTLLPDAILQRLHPGMTKEEVSMILGSSLITPIFNLDRWEYHYSKRVNAKTLVNKTMILHFKQDRLVDLVQK